MVEEINLNKENLKNIKEKILGSNEVEFKLVYLIEEGIPQSKILNTLRPILIEILTKKVSYFELINFFEEIILGTILKPSLRFHLDKFFSYSNYLSFEKYVKEFGESEFKMNDNFLNKTQKYEEKLEKFKSKKIKNVGIKILDDLKKEKEIGRKRFVFVESYPKELIESSVERFVYYIYNREFDFDKTKKLLENNFPKEFIEGILRYLEKSRQIVLSFAVMGDQQFRSTIYFSLEFFEKEVLEEIEKKFNFTFDSNVWGVGFDFKGNKLKSIKTYNIFPEIKVEELKKIVMSIEFEKKNKISEFLNKIDENETIKGVLFDKKIKNKNLFSYRLDFSLIANPKLVGISKEFISFEEKFDGYTISFEISEKFEEKINYYYS